MTASQDPETKVSSSVDGQEVGIRDRKTTITFDSKAHNSPVAINAASPAESHLFVNDVRTRLNDTFPVDDALLELLPTGFILISAAQFGYSAWTVTGRLRVRSMSGEREIFVKLAFGNGGKIMLNGEFESSKLIYKLLPDFIPEPIGFGEYKVSDFSDLPTYFYMSQFVDLDVTTPQNLALFCQRLANLHKASQSEVDKFGFHVTTCDGDRAHVVEWEDSWAVFYRKMFLHTLSLDLKRNGPWPEYERAAQQVAWKVIPRLLEDLTWKGEPIKPSLIHGDLWEGNTGISEDTDLPMLFDAGSYFAHNEMELGHWVCEFSKTFGELTESGKRTKSGERIYIKRYTEFYDKAEPTDEIGDRIRLYSLKGGINYSAGHPNSILRKSAYNSMCFLCEKYAPLDGIDAYDETIDPIKTGATIVSHEEINKT